MAGDLTMDELVEKQLEHIVGVERVAWLKEQIEAKLAQQEET